MLVLPEKLTSNNLSSLLYLRDNERKFCNIDSRLRKPAETTEPENAAGEPKCDQNEAVENNVASEIKETDKIKLEIWLNWTNA